MSRYQPAPIHLVLGTAFYDAVQAAEFPKSILRYRMMQRPARLASTAFLMQILFAILPVLYRWQIICLSRLPCAITAINSGSITRILAMGGGFYLPNVGRKKRGGCWIWARRGRGARPMPGQQMAG